MELIRDFAKKKNTRVIALIMFYDNRGTKPKKVYRVLSCVLYSLIENYVCIHYLSCQSKTLRKISSDRIFQQKNVYILLGIGIPILLLNLVSCHELAEKPNTTVI